MGYASTAGNARSFAIQYKALAGIAKALTLDERDKQGRNACRIADLNK